MNNVNIIGRLTKDPEVRKTDDDRTICTFTLAVDDISSKEDRADFIRVAVFGAQGDVCKRYLHKGFLAGVSGRVRTDQYTDAEGVRRFPVEIIATQVQFLQFPERNPAPEQNHEHSESFSVR